MNCVGVRLSAVRLIGGPSAKSQSRPKAARQEFIKPRYHDRCSARKTLGFFAAVIGLPNGAVRNEESRRGNQRQNAGCRPSFLAGEPTFGFAPSLWTVRRLAGLRSVGVGGAALLLVGDGGSIAQGAVQPHGVVEVLDVADTGMRASARERKRRRARSSHSEVAKKLSHRALSWASPTKPMEGRTPSMTVRGHRALRRLPRASEVYREP